MFFTFFAYLKFLLKSTNAHGIHSPFVYGYVTKCLYNKQRFSSKRAFNVFLKSINYFNYESIIVVENKGLENLVRNTFPSLVSDPHRIDAYYTGKLDIQDFERMLAEKKLHNNSMILIEGIHTSPEAMKHWETLSALPNITVSIDLFQVGVLFIRKEQVKEHFIIRI